MKIKEIMNKAIAIDHNITLKEAAKIMSDKNIGSLIAFKGEKILGIITERDVLNNISNLNAKISTIMAKKVITIEQEEDIDEAALLMTKNKIKRIPVVKDGKLMGIITATDLIANSEDISDEFLFD